MINIVVTSKPVDGLFYYSYEYCDLLNKAGLPARVIVVRHRNFTEQDYADVINTKYIHYKNIIFDDYVPDHNDVSLVLGRSMVTLSWQDFDHYNPVQQQTLKKLFGNKLISVYSENHPATYPKAVEFYNPKKIIDLCDTEVYPHGVGEHFEKIINFSIYKPFENNPKFKYLFLGTNKKYYETVEKVIEQFPDNGVLTYNAEYVNMQHNNIFVPVENVLGMFETYVYTKETFDPAPRILQECRYYNKDIIYLRDKSIVDGGSVYWNRSIRQPNITAITNAVERLK